VLLPGTDPVTTEIEMIPLLGLYASSVALAAWVQRRRERRSAETAGHVGPERFG
jgi:Sec-independent protein secretion pathway component TatC